MCISHRYEQIRPDGRTDRWAEDELCHKSRHNQLCNYTQILEHPMEPFGRMQFPPTPPMSAHSASTSDSERSSKRRSGSYTLDQKVLEINNSKRSPRRERDDRANYGDRSPISRTPPRHQYTLSDSVSSSPDRASYHSRESRRRESIAEERERPTTANSGLAIKIEVAGERPQKTHRRSDASSRTSKASSRDGSDGSIDSERRRRRQSVSFADPPEQEHQRQVQLESEIARANAAIANRPVVPSATSSTTTATTASSTPAPASKPAPVSKPVPVSKPALVTKPTTATAPAPAPASGPVIKPARLSAPVPTSAPAPASAAGSRYRRGSVVVDPLSSKMDKLQIDVQQMERRRREKLRQAEKQAEEQAARDEEEAQKRRLMERMAPKQRRATVGATQRRHKIQYDDGHYRLE